ncbi:DUF6894 family protein [Roseiarcus fermentans]|uniref:DUF6894 family protein n=1 Tax=Roseiarcus fermentans TaxID=1473586 RepID=UPI0011BF9BF9|nr:hypothetical protein [Roseiarcus fermentans]
MRYFFHVLNMGEIREAHSPDTNIDLTGTIFASRQAAHLYATAIAAELAQDGDTYRGFVVFAIDENGNFVARKPVHQVNSRQ